MARRQEPLDEEYQPALPPVDTEEEREKQLIALANSLAERQLRDGTASPSVIVHYLKLGSTREKLEQEKLQQENQHLAAKTEAIHEAKSTEILYREALEAMRTYTGSGMGDDGPT